MGGGIGIDSIGIGIGIINLAEYYYVCSYASAFLPPEIKHIRTTASTFEGVRKSI